MGHRASICYVTEDGCTVHYSHFGAGKLLSEISENSPFGSGNHEPAYVNGLISALETMTEDSDMEFEGKLAEKQDTTPIEPEPYAVIEESDMNKAFMKWATNEIDPIFHESVYFVDTTQSPWKVECYAPVYWRDDPNYSPTGDDPMFALVKTGGEMHSEWGGREADSWEDFVNSLLSDFDNEEITLC